MEPFRNIDEGDIENREASYIEGLHGPNPRVAHRYTACTYWRDKTLSTEVEHCASSRCRVSDKVLRAGILSMDIFKRRGWHPLDGYLQKTVLTPLLYVFLSSLCDTVTVQAP